MRARRKVSPATAQMSPRPLPHPANDAHARHALLVSGSVRGQEVPSPTSEHPKHAIAHSGYIFPRTRAGDPLLTRKSA